jgi:hypothetical protein
MGSWFIMLHALTGDIDIEDLKDYSDFAACSCICRRARNIMSSLFFLKFFSRSAWDWLQFDEAFPFPLSDGGNSGSGGTSSDSRASSWYRVIKSGFEVVGMADEDVVACDGRGDGNSWWYGESAGAW